MNGIALNATHDPARRSGTGPNVAECGFPIKNVVCGVLKTDGTAPPGGVALGDRIIDPGAFAERFGDAARAATRETLASLLVKSSAAVSASREAFSDLQRSAEPGRTAAEAALVPMAHDEPAVPAHLLDHIDRAAGAIRIALAADLSIANVGSTRIRTPGFETMVWTLAPMVTHQASSGAPLEAGDLLASGAVSDPADEAKACLAEYDQRGADQVLFADGATRVRREDGETLTIRAMARADGYVPIGSGPRIRTICPERTI